MQNQITYKNPFLSPYPIVAMHNLQNCWLNELFLLFFHYFKSGIINHSYCARDNYPGIQIHKKNCSGKQFQRMPQINLFKLNFGFRFLIDKK